jgi:hypothetical protein
MAIKRTALIPCTPSESGTSDGSARLATFQECARSPAEEVVAAIVWQEPLP